MTTSGDDFDQHSESQNTREEEEQDDFAGALLDSQHGGIVSQAAQGPRIVTPEKVAGRVAAFGMHTVTVYICAVHVSPWLVGCWFAWIMPTLQISTATPAADWYLQHLEFVSVIPAAIAGYLVARRPGSVATWAWCIPALILIYKMLQYHAPFSVLVGSSVSAVRYFFEIERFMPTMRYTTPSDPVRVLAQMTITAPFYAGVAYSLGAWASKRELLAKLFRFEKPEE